MRLDNFLSLKQNIKSRNKAKELIKNGKVTIGGKIVLKSSMRVTEDSDIAIDDKDMFVSRAGNKLQQFLYDIDIDIKDKTALDIGSSTGGFSEVLLNNKILSIDCVDVGVGQLDQKLRQNPKIEVFENIDIREFSSYKLYDIVVCDVSFISLFNIIEKLDEFFYKNLILLYKPQFEVGKDAKRDAKGVVVDELKITASQKKFESKAESLGWILNKKAQSALKGKRGNIETFYWFKR